MIGKPWRMPTTFPVTCHTHFVGRGSTFVAIRGEHEDGAAYINEALERGATTIVIEQSAELPPSTVAAIKVFGAQLLRVENTRKALALMSAQAAGFPARALHIIGITGTKGKTTTAYLLAHILRSAGLKVGLATSVNVMIDGHAHRSPLTTPQPDYLHQFLAQCVNQNVSHVVMEVAAQATTLYRTHGILFDAAIFTNFCLEHLEFYKTMDDYFAAKAQLFAQRRPSAPAFLNADDEHCAVLAQQLNCAITFGTTEQAQVPVIIKASGAQPVTCILTLAGTAHEFRAPACIGFFNGYNIAAAVIVAVHCGVAVKDITASLASFAGVPGRMECYRLPNGAIAIIDYAHNPSSYQALLSTLREMTGHLTVIFGAGGRKDPSKRPHMGRIAAQYADCVVLTTDNPRDEDPHTIIADIESGIPCEQQYKIMRALDRAAAIQKACQESIPGAIIAILGKGPDEYQIIGSRKMPFCESAILKELGACRQLQF